MIERGFAITRQEGQTKVITKLNDIINEAFKQVN